MNGMRRDETIRDETMKPVKMFNFICNDEIDERISYDIRVDVTCCVYLPVANLTKKIIDDISNCFIAEEATPEAEMSPLA